MLKGLKKSKPNPQDVINSVSRLQNIQGELTHEIQNKKITPNEIRNLQLLPQKNQLYLKSKFAMEEEMQESDQQQQRLRQLRNKAYDQDLKKKAQFIMQLYSEGNQQKVKQEVINFQRIEKDLFKLQTELLRIQNQKPKFLKTSQIIDGQSGLHVKETEIGQNLVAGQKKPGKFDYNFDYEQKDEQENKRKRSYKSRPIRKAEKVQDYCLYCPDNQELRLISASNYVYLAFPKRKTFKKYWHFLLAPVDHQQSTIGLNDDVTTEISNYKKCLLQMFDKRNCLVVFWEQYSEENSHIYIECLAVPYGKGQDFPFFFRQALDTVEGNWTTHKNILKIQKQKGGLQKQIPKQIKYFYIDFSLGYGYAHVIENEKFWKRDFCNQIIATAINLQLYQVKTAAQFTDEELDLKQQQFKKMWQPFDWTKYI